MSRIVYVNGEYLPEEKAKISVFDRGFLFSDGVYEVISVLNGKLIDTRGHMLRLNRSLGELDMAAPCSAVEIESIVKKLVAENSVEQGLVYLQITRGAADRDFFYPENPSPTLVMFTQSKNLLDDPNAEQGIDVITVPDLRWQRRDIKSVGLLYPCMAKMEAKMAGAKDAWMLDADGYVTEGTSNNAWIITQEGTIVTRQLSNDILHGITRKAVMALAGENDFSVEQRPFTPADAYEAAEAFVTSATTFVMPVVKIDAATIGNGLPGEMTGKLREIYIDMALRTE
ncbi:D-amino acid aminotransferase [Solemya velum gill symbiont]|uniref:D-amino-acid transaminase n=1 Tax=Solemya velum gill symbiont TaxID=2340 RepID=UPI0009964560|nr:D-amino-acid transaminase [Solemya velum gill symbiont]OOY49491.1 D-amino acid aminotransferase [Solemya velum gill symbiont]